MKSDSFVVLSSMLDSAKCLEAGLRNELCYAILEYGFNGELVECSPIIKAVMLSIMPNIDSSKSRYIASVENGKKGGRPRTKKKPKPNPEVTQPKPNPNLDKDKDKDKDVDKDKERRKLSVITPATTVADYLLSKILAEKPNFKKPDIQTWAKDIDRAMRIDKRTEQELIGCIDWIYSAGSFWVPNILSGRKLREKFDTMESQMMSTGKQNTQTLKNLQMMEDIRNEI